MKDSIRSDKFSYEIETGAIKEAPPGALDGITLFRFAHMWRRASSGGVEAYLRDLNRLLLERNRMRILQMYLAPEIGPVEVEIEQVGRGELVWIPSIFKNNQEQQITRAQRLWARVRRLHRHQFRICHDTLLSTFANYEINLAVFHWISEDSKIVLDYLNNRRVPFVVVNHFQNKRLKRRMIRKQISKALAIGGVSGVDVPSFVRSRFTNLSDAVDTDFFHPEKATPLESKPAEPLIFFPSRITEEKGHLDAVRALGLLARAGINAVLAFAGQQGSPAFIERLKMTISDEGAHERVIFAGELCPEELRNWYAAADIVVLPSYAEGLGRVLLEAQAMEKPVVAYDVGGVREAIQHSETGYLVKKGIFEELAWRLKELLEDGERRCKMGDRGRRFVIDRYDVPAVVARHEDFYCMAIQI